MFIIIDKKIPEPARRKLETYGRLVELSTRSITYESISGHPDIFFCQIDETIVTAPNLPNEIIQKIEAIDPGNILYGDHVVGNTYPETAHYNAVVTDTCLIHNLKLTDQKILDLCKEKEHIHVEQGYTRCNLLALKDDHFITSDKGIEKALKNYSKELIYVNPKAIKLEGFQNGFFGGACGVYNDKVFIIGELDLINEGKEIKALIRSLGYQIIELYKGEVFDAGGILFF